MKYLRSKGVLALGLLGLPAGALEITVDYRYDIHGFFTPATTQGQQARAAVEAAAARYSRIITTQLGGAMVLDDTNDARVAFMHPGTGQIYQVSSAASAASDALVGAGQAAANEYRGSWSLAPGTWVLYAGGNTQGYLAYGGTGAGTNFSAIYSDPNSVLNRGFNSGLGSLPVWGGSVTFDATGATPWHFDPTTAPGEDEVDLYSLALHEIGHAFGLATQVWTDWRDQTAGDAYTGLEGLIAYNSEHGTALSELPLVSNSDHHWADDALQSGIFALGEPNLVGTVGPGALQDLLMDPSFNFANAGRFELTNVEVAALRDIGWSVVPEPSTALVGGWLMAGWLVRRRREE